MTSEQRLDRLEMVTAGMAEQFRKDRDIDRQLWRETQRQITEVSLKLQETDDRLGRRIEELIEADLRLGKRIDETNATVRELAERIAALVSGFGEWMNRNPRA